MGIDWRRGSGGAAVAWSLIFAGAHFYWALGGEVGLAVSAGPELAAERPAWFVAGGLWGVGLLCLVGAVVGWRLRRGRPGALIRAAGWVAGVVLLVRALAVEAMLLAGPTLDDTVGPEHRLWTLVLWNPWFAAGGLAFLAAAWTAQRSRPLDSRPD